MTLRAVVEPLSGRLPQLMWRWDAETDILSGSFRAADEEAEAGMVEYTDALGSIVVVELQNGRLAGVDLVVWPEVSAMPRLALPRGVMDGVVTMVPLDSRAAVGAYEIDTEMEVLTDGAETVMHLRLGEEEPTAAVRVADHLIVEVTDSERVAGFWFTGVPAFPDYDSA